MGSTDDSAAEAEGAEARQQACQACQHVKVFTLTCDAGSDMLKAARIWANVTRCSCNCHCMRRCNNTPSYPQNYSGCFIA
jgi:hypothetical protein